MYDSQAQIIIKIRGFHFHHIKNENQSQTLGHRMT